MQLLFSKSPNLSSVSILFDVIYLAFLVKKCYMQPLFTSPNQNTHPSFETGGTGVLRLLYPTESMLVQCLYSLVSLTFVSFQFLSKAGNEFGCKGIKRWKTKFLLWMVAELDVYRKSEVLRLWQPQQTSAYSLCKSWLDMKMALKAVPDVDVTTLSNLLILFLSWCQVQKSC